MTPLPPLHLQQTIMVLCFHPCLVCVPQVQYSVIDQRPAVKMEQFCLANNIKLLTYGTLGKVQHFTSSCFCPWREVDTYKKKIVQLSFRFIDVISTFIPATQLKWWVSKMESVRVTTHHVSCVLLFHPLTPFSVFVFRFFSV